VILPARNCAVALIDFGLARSLDFNTGDTLTRLCSRIALLHDP